MTRKIFLVLALFVGLISCQKNTTIHFRTTDAKGLEIGDFIMLDAKTIGHVSDFGLTDYGAVIISSELSPEISVPSNSKFKNATYDQAGRRCIKVTLGSSETPLNHHDTLKLGNSYDKAIDKVKEKLIDKIKDTFKKED